MAEIKANGDGIVACANEILKLCDQYDAQIADFFDSLTALNKTTWVGGAANAYVAQASAARTQYANFGEYLRYYGKVAKIAGDNVNKMVSKWEDK